MTYHMHPGELLEQALELEEDPHERARLIDEAYSLLVDTALEAVVAPEEAA